MELEGQKDADMKYCCIEVLDVYEEYIYMGRVWDLIGLKINSAQFWFWWIMFSGGKLQCVFWSSLCILWDFGCEGEFVY